VRQTWHRYIPFRGRDTLKRHVRCTAMSVGYFTSLRTLLTWRVLTYIPDTLGTVKWSIAGYGTEEKCPPNKKENAPPHIGEKTRIRISTR
jgi:hypothetical protein